MLDLNINRITRLEKTIVWDVRIQHEAPGLLWIVGPGGAGKSSLLAVIANDPRASGLAFVGELSLFGEQLSTTEGHTVYLGQTDQLDYDADANPIDSDGGSLAAVLADNDWFGVNGELDRRTAEGRRFLAIMARLQQPASLYVLDEPTAGLSQPHVDAIRDRIAELGVASTMIVATHNRQDCLTLGGTTALLVAGELKEVALSRSFFTDPQTIQGRVYVDTGNCGTANSRSSTPLVHGIWWVVPGLLCGMSRPGMVEDAAIQYQNLAEKGVGFLLCLEERCVNSADELRAAGISQHHFSMPDMAPPSFTQAVQICRLVEGPIRANVGVAAHCRGGLGRTGTVLAAIYIWFGDSDEEAIAKIRAAQPLAIQSASQLRFLADFADRIRGWH